MGSLSSTFTPPKRNNSLLIVNHPIAYQEQFKKEALDIFHWQYQANPVYHKFCELMGSEPGSIKELKDIPFLPIGFFRSHDVTCFPGEKHALEFQSSGTGSNVPGRHLVKEERLYQQSLLSGFEKFFGKPDNYIFLALLPSYLERKGSSLVYMMDQLMRSAPNPLHGFFLHEHSTLVDNAAKAADQGKIPFIIGVTYALLDLAESGTKLPKTSLVVETGGMKGMRKEIIREEVHELLKNGLHVSKIFSEYGMTEMLSQAWSSGDGIFSCTDRLKVLIRDVEDPRSFLAAGKSGGINVIDLANRNSCAFIATDDQGKLLEDGRFEVLGRLDHADLRGCNLL